MMVVRSAGVTRYYLLFSHTQKKRKKEKKDHTPTLRAKKNKQKNKTLDKDFFFSFCLFASCFRSRTRSVR